MFDLRLRAFDPVGHGGAERGIIPRPPALKRYARRGEPPTLSADWSELSPRSPLLAAPCEVAVEHWDGTQWTEPRDGRVIVAEDKHERLADINRMHSLTGVGLVTLLEGATVWTDAVFEDASPGEIMRTLILAAQARGALPMIALGFSNALDSNGDPWAHTIPRGYEASHDLWQVLKGLADGGLCDFWMQGRTLHMSNPDAGRDLSTGLSPVYLRDVQIGESPESHDYRSLADTVMLIGDEGARWDSTNPAAITPWGRREKVMTASGVTSGGAAQLLMDAELLVGQDASRTLTRQWEYHEGVRWMPDRDLNVGDWILADTAVGTRQRLRIADMAVTADETSITAFVTLGTVRDEALVRMIKAQRARDGSNVIASGTPTPPPPINDGSQWPAAPTNITITAGTWTNDNGQTQGQVSASWDEVTTDTNGQPIQIKGYQLRGRRTSAPATGWMDIWRAESSSGSGTKAEVGTGETWNFQLAAVSPTFSDASGVGDNTGPFAPVPAIVVTVQADTQAPGVPSAPTLSSTPGVLTVAWDGLSDSGQDMPPDFLHAVVELEGIVTERPWTLSGAGELRIDAGRDEPIQIGGVHRARLKTVDRAGNESNWGNWSSFVTVRDRDIWPVQVPSVTATTSTVLGPDGRGVGVIHADWLAVATDTEGNPISISHYVVRVQQSGQLGWHEFRTGGNVTTADCSNPDFVVGTTWNVRVAAVHVNGNDNWTGAFSPPDTVTIGPDTVPPSVPSTPLVSSSMAGLTITWDGLTSTGAQMPIDLAHIEAVITGRATPVPIDKITRQVTIWDVTVGTSYEVKLRAVDYAGNVSALSAAASATVVSAITGLQAQIDQVEQDFAAADAALQGQIDSIVVSSSGGVVTWMGPTTPVAPSQRPHIAGDLWWDTSTGTQKRYDGSTWVTFQLGDDGISGLSAAKITTGYLDAARIKVDAAWVTGPLLIGNTDEVIVDPTWQNADLNADRTRTGWTVAPNLVTHTQAVAEDFYLGTVSDWSDPRSYLPLREGVRYRVEATVRLTTSGQVSLVQRNSNGGYGYISGPVALGANTDYVLVGEFTWEQYPGSFGVRMDKPGTIKSVSVRPMLAQVLIQDGLISAPKLAANAVTADKINAGAVTALKLSTDALDFKSATGMVLTSPTIQSHTEAFRGFKLTPTAFKLYSSDGLGTEWFSADSSGVRVAGDYQTTGLYPRLEIKRDLMGSTFSGIRWYPQAGWQSWPELKITSTAWGVDTPGGLYAVGGTRHNLTMHPELALRSGYMSGSTEVYWPKADLLLGAGGTTYGRIRIEDLGLNTTAFSAYANFHDLFTPSRAQELLLNVPGSPGDIRIKSAAAGISLEVGNGWLRAAGLGTSTGGEDIRMEGNWRLVYQTSLSADKLDQERMGVHYELLDLKATSWIDRVRREEDPSWDVRYGGWIAEDVQAISEANGDSLAPALVHRGGELSGINDKAINALHLDITADVVRRLSRVEAAVERILDAA